jgi:hypothetical protein
MDSPVGEGPRYSPMAHHRDVARFGWEAWEPRAARPQATALYLRQYNPMQGKFATVFVYGGVGS